MSNLVFNDTEEIPLTFFADVILPLPLPRLYTYRVPAIFNHVIISGIRVVVQFGVKKIYTGIVHHVHQKPPDHYEAKSILDVLDETPLINSQQLDLFEWIAEYYLCTLGEVINMAIPSGLKLTSQSKIQINPEYDRQQKQYEFSEREAQVIDALQKKDSLTYTEISTLLQLKNIHPVIKSLLAKGRIILYEEVKEKYVPKTIRKVKLSSLYTSPGSLEKLFENLEKTPAQSALLIKYLQKISPRDLLIANENGLEKKTLVEGSASDSSLRALIKKNIFEEFSELVPRFGSNNFTGQEIVLSAEQGEAKVKIIDLFKEKNAVLLHGITGSGKTEIYIDIIKDALNGGSQVLYLLPEIALTTQIVSRLRKVFGAKMGVYHSRFSDHERVEVWKGILSGALSFVVGVRSSIFLPFSNLGLIVIDEEHDTSYKQHDSAPRYHAREAALVLARFHHAKVLLGSGTPAIESCHNAMLGKWGKVNLDNRYGGAKLPEISIVDMRKERRNKTARNDLSGAILEEINNTKQQKQQTILFQNRRGYSPILACMDCGYIPKCHNCSVSLTYHMYKAEVTCHYCGHSEEVPKKCPACESPRIRTQGFGTEKIEDDLRQFVPDIVIQRMDLDTTRKKNSFEKIISEFESGQTDVLIGTQMVSKGFDFGNVRLVGILDADRLIHFPDFRSYERAFQLFTQVSGRAGRRDTMGKVLIQSNNPDHMVLDRITRYDYVGFYDFEISERKKFKYPPFSRIIKVVCKDLKEEVAESVALKISEALVSQLGKSRVLGPEPPLVNKIRNYHLREIYLKIEKEKIDIKKVKISLKKIVEDVLNNKEHYNSIVVMDVDPV